MIILDARNDPTFRISKFFDDIEVAEAVEVIETAEVLRPEKSLLRTSEYPCH